MLLSFYQNATTMKMSISFLPMMLSFKLSSFLFLLVVAVGRDVFLVFLSISIYASMDTQPFLYLCVCFDLAMSLLYWFLLEFLKRMKFL